MSASARDLLDAACASKINLSATPQLAGIARSELDSAVGSVADQRSAIISALDLLITRA
jgi:hypothetical protein